MSMVDAISFQKVAMSVEDNFRKVTIQAPAALKVQPESSYRLYTEPDTTENPGTNVICSGTALLINQGSSTGDAQMIGILAHDAQPGDTAVCAVEGLFLLQATPTIGAADTLNAKPAYFDVDDGLVYASAGGTSDNRLLIGYFDGGISELELQTNKISGYYYVSVRLDPALMMTNTAQSVPSNASSLTNTATPYVAGEISAFGGLSQLLTVSATSPDPRYQGGDLTLSVTVEGTEIYSGPFKSTVNATFTAGSGKTVVFAVTDPAGNSGNATYTVTMHATNAPASWTRS